jgi:Raf kinase inhibitor-like YbhB/YbcL family protein
MSFAIETPAFQNDEEIPRKFTCSGAGVSPPLRWVNPPNGVHTFALIVDDPDAPLGTFTHWLIWNIPAGSTDLPEGLPRKTVLENGVNQGTNDFNRIGYGGSCPPAGKPHRYFFRLYALDVKLEARPGATRSELDRAMANHIVAQAEYKGTFRR